MKFHPVCDWLLMQCMTAHTKTFQIPLALQCKTTNKE